MTDIARQNLLKNKAQLIFWITEIDRVIHDIAVKGTASASISAGGGSKSYTKLDVSKLYEVRMDYTSRVSQIQRRLAGVPSTGIRHVMTVRG